MVCSVLNYLLTQKLPRKAKVVLDSLQYNKLLKTLKVAQTLPSTIYLCLPSTDFNQLLSCPGLNLSRYDIVHSERFGYQWWHPPFTKQRSAATREGTKRSPIHVTTVTESWLTAWVVCVRQTMTMSQNMASTPANTKSCSLGLQRTTLVFDIHVNVNWYLSKQGIGWLVSQLGWDFSS